MRNRREFLALSGIGLATAASGTARPRPNIVQILADDMGYGDLQCYGGEIATPHLDRLAAQGLRFRQAYDASPVCSPSRVGITTGQFPSRQYIYSYLDTRQRQRELRERDYLDPQAPCIARSFQQAGYATGHFGKWHMGGGRDVGDAPPPTAYGFDESLTSFEGLGERVLPPGKLSDLNEKLGRGKISHAPQSELTEIYVNRAIDFVERSTTAHKPFYVHLWPNEVHDPFDPKPALLRKYDRFSANKYKQQYYAMLDNMDQQIGRLISAVERLGQAQNTLFIFFSDNGPTAWPYYYQQGLQPPGSTNGLRGRKWSLYEGGIRTSWIVRWDGTIPAGKYDQQSVISAVDLFPTCCRLAGITLPAVAFDGEDMSAAFLGQPVERKKDLLWDYGRDQSFQQPGLAHDQSPNLAIRSGPWKLLINDNGSRQELYNLVQSEKEEETVAVQHPKIAQQLSEKLLRWRRSLPLWETKAGERV
jgi:arylsulfatase A-like enzyme